MENDVLFGHICLDNDCFFMFLFVLEKHYYFTLSYKYINKRHFNFVLEKMMKRFFYCFRIDLAVVGAYLWENHVLILGSKKRIVINRSCC